jgi:anti-anti-sigma regulatory factor
MPQLKVRKARGAAVLAVKAVPLCETVVREALVVLAKAGCRNAVIDLNGLAPDPSLVKPLLALRRDVHKKSGRLVLCGLSAETQELFRATWLLSLFEVKPDVNSALACLRSNGEPAHAAIPSKHGRNGVASVRPRGAGGLRRGGGRAPRGRTPPSRNGKA